jgi:hypothetical protein
MTDYAENVNAEVNAVRSSGAARDSSLIAAAHIAVYDVSIFHRFIIIFCCLLFI